MLFEALFLFSRVLLGEVRERHCMLWQSSRESCYFLLITVCEYATEQMFAEFPFVLSVYCSGGDCGLCRLLVKGEFL